ncbi:hypothetical protein QRD90_18240 [Peribacillus frigoritolerans]|uniref:hypothetical protein n=1 Tax=Peribacillus frigoritolerans TaxID=450367 RepID=UPI002570F48F|nr:hypothetical protein [Peribacillus frigoritolerans]WJE46154.1 hypothetical protein QRD90_18240 [Peribacillus frigoritolerans]
MGTEILMEKEEDTLNNRKKPMVVKLNSEQLDDIIRIFPNTGGFFGLKSQLMMIRRHF